MRSLVRAPLVAVKRAYKVPSSHRRGWYCSAACSTAVAGRRTTCSDGTRSRPAVPITHARQEAWAGTPLACTARSARGLFLLRRPRAWSRASRSVGRPHSPPSPRHLLPRTAQHLAAHHPTHRRSIGVRARSRERGALVQRHLAPLADPRRRVGLRARVCYARGDGWRSRAWPSDGCARWVRPSAAL